MRGNREEMLESVKVIKFMLNETEKELLKSDSAQNGSINPNYDCSLEKIKRNCTVLRELLLQLRKGCEWEQ